MMNYLDNEIKIIEQKKLEKVIKGLECCAAMSGDKCRECSYSKECIDADLPYGMPHLAADALALLKAQESVEPNGEQYQCNKCKFYQGVHNVMGHAPCSFWNIGGVMWDDYCSRFRNSEATIENHTITINANRR